MSPAISDISQGLNPVSVAWRSQVQIHLPATRLICPEFDFPMHALQIANWSASFQLAFSGYASVNSTSAHPPGQPRGICSRGGAFVHPGVTPPPRNLIHEVSKPSKTPAGLRVLFLTMVAFVRKDMDFVSQWLVREGLDKLIEVFRGEFSNFRKFPSAL